MSGHERTVVGSTIVAILASVGFIVAYALDRSRLMEGVIFAVAAAALCAAFAGCVAWLVPQEKVIDEREQPESEPLYPLPRISALSGLIAVACGTLLVAAIVPIRSLAPNFGNALFHTRWRRGTRLCREDGTPVRAGELNTDSMETVFPEHALDDPQSQAVLIRLPVDISDAPQGYVAYSKLCTHAGCPVAQYRARAKQLLCPCHQSLFDVVDAGRVISGPADHPLPQLPLMIGSDGYVRAANDFPVPVGPGFWGRA